MANRLQFTAEEIAHEFYTEQENRYIFKSVLIMTHPGDPLKFMGTGAIQADNGTRATPVEEKKVKQVQPAVPMCDACAHVLSAPIAGVQLQNLREGWVYTMVVVKAVSFQEQTYENGTTNVQWPSYNKYSRPDEPVCKHTPNYSVLKEQYSKSDVKQEKKEVSGCFEPASNNRNWLQTVRLQS